MSQKHYKKLMKMIFGKPPRLPKLWNMRYVYHYKCYLKEQSKLTHK